MKEESDKTRYTSPFTINLTTRQKFKVLLGYKLSVKHELYVNIPESILVPAVHGWNVVVEVKANDS